jgi:hypothetical protein
MDFIDVLSDVVMVNFMMLAMCWNIVIDSF